MYGALRTLPEEVIEAAQLDGCGGLRVAWSIKFPQVRRYVVLIVILSFATGTQVFVERSLLFGSGIGFVGRTCHLPVKLLLRVHVRPVRSQCRFVVRTVPHIARTGPRADTQDKLLRPGTAAEQMVREPCRSWRR